MNNRRSAIIFWLATLAFTVAGVAVVYVIKSHPRTVPWDACSEVYRRYANTDGVQATYIQDYRVNDTLTVNVTLLQATDSAGWQQLIADFEIPEESIETASKSATGGNLLTIQGKHVTDTQIPVVSCRDKYICTFHTRDKKQKEQVIMAILRLITNSIKDNRKLASNEENN